MSRNTYLKWKEDRKYTKQKTSLGRTENKANLAAQAVYYEEISRLFKVLARTCKTKSK